LIILYEGSGGKQGLEKVKIQRLDNLIVEFMSKIKELI